MRPMYYNRDGSPRKNQDVLDWAKEFEKNRTVAKTTLPDGKEVSTVFLGLDHNFAPIGPPLIFETMIFSSKSDSSDLDMDRYSTEEQVIKGHEEMVKKWSKRGKK